LELLRLKVKIFDEVHPKYFKAPEPYKNHDLIGCILKKLFFLKDNKLN